MSVNEKDLSEVLADREQALEADDQPIVSVATCYGDGVHIPEHTHSRSQLLHALSGMVAVTTRFGRWIVPPEHGLWIPNGISHSVDAIGDVRMYSVYIRPGALAALPSHLHVARLTTLMRSLIATAETLAAEGTRDERARLILQCLLYEIPMLKDRPLAVPFPGDPRLASLCRAFLDNPIPHGDTDGWARRAGMSRRSFTRLFRRETGFSLAAWRQQACILVALPRLNAGEPVTSIALDLGYESVPAFTTMFKRILGAPPKAWLRLRHEGRRQQLHI